MHSSPYVADCTLVPAADVDVELLTQFVTEVLNSAFPADELMTLDEILECWQAGTLHASIIREGSLPVAGIILEDYVDGAVTLISYVAVRSGRRSSGFGRRLVVHAVAEARAARPGVSVLVEYEHPEAPATDAYGDPRARVRFWEAAGARQIPIPYVQPALRPGATRVPMQLAALEAPDSEFDAQVLRDFLREYFEDCEGEEPSDAEYVRLLHAAAAAPLA
jgi:GNAT superfamily N-acetyltransferase